MFSPDKVSPIRTRESGHHRGHPCAIDVFESAAYVLTPAKTAHRAQHGLAQTPFDMVATSLLPPAPSFLPNRLLLFCLPYARASASVDRDWGLIALVHLKSSFAAVACMGVFTKNYNSATPYNNVMLTLFIKA
jgi:hypothetical protein